MFSIKSLREKAKKTDLKLSMIGYVGCVLKNEFLEFISVQIFIILIGAFMGAFISAIFHVFHHISSMQFLINSITVGILSALITTFLLYKDEYKQKQKENYKLSQQEMKEYLKILPSKEYKNKAVSLIETVVNKNKGNLSLYDFEKIYNDLEKEVKQYEQEEILKLESIKTAEASACLVRVLKEDIEENDNIILNLEDQKNVVHK